MQPQHLIRQAMDTDDHCRSNAGLLDQPAPLRNSLAVPGIDDRFRRVRRNVYRDLPPTVVLERLRDKLSQDCAGGAGGRSFGLTGFAVILIVLLLRHGLAFIERAIGSILERDVRGPSNPRVPAIPALRRSRS